MKIFLTAIFLFLMLISCKRPVKSNNYRVHRKDSANFSIMAFEVQPQERMVVKINDDIIWDDLGKDSLGNPGSWRYYHYPKKIRVVQFIDYYKGIHKINNIFKDTLLEVARRTLIISRPYPKGLTKANWRRYGFVSIDTGARSVTLVNDAVAFKGMCYDNVY